MDIPSRILVTGVAGFIGMHVARRLLQDGHTVTGIDNLNDYYSPALKEARLAQLLPLPRFTFHRADLADRDAMETVFAQGNFSTVIHLGAQAGVRYSLSHPHAYIHSNINGFLHILEGCRHHRIRHLVFASSSSVYGLNTKMPFAPSDPTDHPVSLYAATKKSNELMAHAYAHLYRLPCTGLRFFTVYGPWGRPDMAPWIFIDKILRGQPIQVFNYGKMKRDFTYIDDIVEGVVRAAAVVPTPDPAWSAAAPNPASSSAPYRLHNIGNHQPVELTRFISAIEQATGKRAICEFLPLQPGDVLETSADIDSLTQATGFHPTTSIEQGMERFAAWFRDYHHL
jgi:UDP-glucuronate 4-epimerase